MLFFKKNSRKILTQNESTYYKNKPLPPIIDTTSACYYSLIVNDDDNNDHYFKLVDQSLPRPQDLAISSFNIPHLLMPIQPNHSVLDILEEKIEHKLPLTKIEETEECIVNASNKKRNVLLTINTQQETTDNEKLFNSSTTKDDSSLISEKTIVNHAFTNDENEKKNNNYKTTSLIQQDNMNEMNKALLVKCISKEQEMLTHQLTKKKKRVDFGQLSLPLTMIPREVSSTKTNKQPAATLKASRIYSTLTIEPSISTPLTRKLRQDSSSRIPIRINEAKGAISTEKVTTIVPTKSNSTCYSSRIPKRKDLWF
ncbi:uncharacterized protein BX663DRAFT_551783 [Cokeromyces recurvatus]|uniref:uncharacterized protein n=1 Tax=Cokeromyces recurvatus TaxID=90255 RepID=UPI00221E9BDE|nr:uncharacterized protein BX663DRAFT_551783 [Cokeromyces recurvatus]KAI7902921.1 hypothetical protein BX663DRAFT_551783 [Cokeromyces recurvatus]